MPLRISFLVSLILGGAISLALSEALKMFFGYAADLNFMISVGGIVTFFGLFMFQVGPWSDALQKRVSQGVISESIRSTPLQILMDAVGSWSAMMIFGALFVVALLVFTGNTKTLVSLLTVLADKLVRIVQAILY